MTAEVKTARDVIQGYFDETEHLSHSSFEAFIKSPKHFIEYKTDKREKTDAMIFGSLFHCMVLEPDEVEERYLILPEDAPRRPSIRQIEAKKPSDSTLDAIAFWNAMEASGKELISQSLFDTALMMKTAVYENESSRWVLDRIDQTEVNVSWKFGGFKWIGYQDGRGEKIIMDLKTIADATPRKVERAILYEGHARQAAHYTKGAGFDYDYFIVAVDKGCHVTTVHVRDTTIKSAWGDIEYYIKRFKNCLLLNQWNQSYDFWAGNGGIYEV